MFDQQSDKFSPDQHQENFRVSNRAMILAVIAFLISGVGVVFSFLPKNNPATAHGAMPTPDIAVMSLSPTVKPIIAITTPKPKTRQTPEPEPTPDYPYRHQPTPEFPNDGALFSLYYSAYQMVFRWHSNTASEAVKYRVRIERRLPLGLGWKYWDVDVDSNQDWCAMQFANTGMYRWRMTPVFADGSMGLSTQWRTFQFTQ